VGVGGIFVAVGGAIVAVSVGLENSDEEHPERKTIDTTNTFINNEIRNDMYTPLISWNSIPIIWVKG